MSADTSSGKPIDKDDIHPIKMRRFMAHLASAARIAEERSVKKNTIKDKLEKIRSISLNKRSTKQMIEAELGTFESAVHDVIKDEEKILEEQRKETKHIAELRKTVEELSRKMIQLGREYAQELEHKDGKIMELREALATAHIKISESGEDRQRKIEDIERKIKQNQSVPPRPKAKHEVISEVEQHLASLEEQHANLKKMGKHSKHDLDRLKSMIDRHKQSLAVVKGVSIPLLVTKAPAPKMIKKPKPKKSKPKKSKKK
jgi:chromosome segregation ATPase